MTIEQTLPIRVDLVGEDAITQGSWWRREFAFVQDDGELWDTTNFQAFMRSRSSVGGPVLLDLAWYSGRVVTGIRGTAPNQYNLAIELTATDTSGLTPWGLALYDLIVKDTSGRWMRVLEGTVALSPMIMTPV